jgi:hypothetical protein
LLDGPSAEQAESLDERAGHTTVPTVQGSTERLAAAREDSRRQVSPYSRWKRKLSFWPRKLVMLVELALYIAVGVILGQLLEVLGVVRYLAVLTWPITRLGALPRAAGPPLLMALQSGAVANSMLVASRDQGQLNNRHLYTAVLVVSCLSLFAHLPTFIVPIGMAFGPTATAALFGARFSAIFVEIIVVLAVSNWLIRRRGEKPLRADGAPRGREPASVTVRPARRRGQEQQGIWTQVFHRSRRTLKRLGIYVVPTFLVMASLERVGFFGWLTRQLPSVFAPSFLPAQAAAIIPAQALSLYNGAIAAASFVDSGTMTVRQAILVILVGSLLTAPIRTLKHALPTYVAVLGARPGMVMALSAQGLRIVFTALAIAGLAAIWR